MYNALYKIKLYNYLLYKSYSSTLCSLSFSDIISGALGITFPFNITIGMPLYYLIVQNL
jgi:hypothetical protein